MFYEDDDEYIPLKITLLDVQGYYNILENDSKTMNFKLDDDPLGKITDIFDYIGEILKIGLYQYLYDSNSITYISITYFKTKVSDDTGFRKNNDKTTKYSCRVLLQYNLFTIIIKIYVKM